MTRTVVDDWGTYPWTAEEVSRIEALRATWAVVCPAHSYVEPMVQRTFTWLQAHGVAVLLEVGSSDIAATRSRMAEEVLRRQWQRVLWVDADTLIMPHDALRMLADPEPFLAAPYPRRGSLGWCCDLTGVPEIVIGDDGKRLEIPHTGFGAVALDRAVLEAVGADLRPARGAGGERFRPFFLPMIVEGPDGDEWLAEDYAFCRRARDCGFRVVLDTRLRVGHIGKIVYHAEHAAGIFGRGQIANTVSCRLKG